MSLLRIFAAMLTWPRLSRASRCPALPVVLHAAAPHFLWPFAVRYAENQLNLWPRVSLPETSPTLRWTGEVGDASAFWVWGTLSHVRDTTATKISPRTLRCAFLGFPTDAPPWQFCHPRSQPLGVVLIMARPEEKGGKGASESGEAKAQCQPRDPAMSPMQPSLGPPRDEPRLFGFDKFNSDNFAEWSFRIENVFDHYDLLEVMEGMEKRLENDPEKSPWVRKSGQGYLLFGQALGISQIRHIKPFQRELDKRPKARATLKGVHAPATAAVAVVLERQMATLRIEEDEPVEEGVHTFFDLLTRLEEPDLNYSELQKKTKLLALLPESWSSLIINLNRDRPRLSLEDVKRAILQEDFRRRELASADGAGAASISRGYGRGRGRGRGGGRFGGSNFNRGRGSGGYGSDDKSYGRGRGRFDGECLYCHKNGHMWREGRGAGGGRERGRGGRGGRGGGAANMKSDGNESESRDDRFPGQFFFVSTQAPAGPEKDEGFEEPAAVGKVTLLSLDYWVIDSGATYSMTPQVKGMGKAMFKGADGKMVGMKNATAEAPLDEVVMDVVCPLKLGAARAEYFLTIVDIYTRMTWGYVLSKKSDVAETVKTDWLPMVERQQDWLVKSIRTDRGGEFLRKEFGLWLKKNVIRHSLTMPYSPAMNGIAERANCILRNRRAVWGGEEFGSEHVELPLELSSGITTTRQSTLVNGGEEAMDAEEEEEEVQQSPRSNTKAFMASQHCPERQCECEECAFVFFSPVEMAGEPATLKETLESSDAEEWKKAMESELKSIEENDTCELVELPEGRKAITSKWLFKIKFDADSKIERYKSRLVAKGYQQKEKVDFKELFAPVVKPTRLRTLLVGAAIEGWVVKQMDVTKAFLNGILEEEIFSAQPEGPMREVLEEIGFTPSTVDHSLFMLGEGEQRSFMVVYVDDILNFSPSSDLVKEVMLKLQDKFKCKALGDVNFYHGLHIERDVEKRCMRVHQRKYLEALAANFGQSECHAATPFPSGFKCVKGPEEESVGEEERCRFHSLVGSLMYAAVNTRPDVAFATGQLARVVQCPYEEQVAAGMRVAKNHGQTPTVGLQYPATAQRCQKGAYGVEPGRLFLTAFSDACYASEPEDMTSVGGFICCVGGGPTAWESKKQVDQALSSMESEYMALFRAVWEIVWQRRLLAELGEEQQGPTPLYYDSQSVIALAKNPVLHGLTKHMRVKWHWTRSMVAAGEVELRYVKTTGQPADMMTKRLGPAPLGVSQVDPPPLVEPLVVSSDTSGLAEGGGPAADDTAAILRSPRLETPLGFPPRPSSPPLRPVAVDTGAAGGGDIGGEDAGGAGPRGAETGGAETRGEGSGGEGSGGPRAAGAGGPAGAAGAGGAAGVGGAGAGGAGADGTGGARARGTSSAGGAEGAAGAVGVGAGGAGGAGAAGTRGAAGTGGALARGARAAGAGGAGAAGARGAGGAAGAGGIGAGGTGAADGTGTVPRRPFFYLQPQSSLPWLDSALCQVLSLPSSTGLTPPPLYPPSPPSPTHLPPGSPLPAPSPYTELSNSLTERHEPKSLASTLRVALPSPLASSLPDIHDPESDLAPNVTRLLATVVTDPSFEYTVAISLVTELLDFAARRRLDYVANPDALDIPTPRSYAEAIAGEYSSQWQTAMDAGMASWKSTGTYIDKVPPPGANIVDGMWIFRVKRPPGSPLAFKARYVARGLSQRHRVDFFQRCSRLKMTLAAHGFSPSSADPSSFLRTDTSLPPFYVLVYVDDLVFATAVTDALALDRAQRTITLTQSQMVHQVLQRFGFTWSSPQPIPLPTGHSLLDPPSDEPVEPSGPYPELVGCLMYLMTCTRPDLVYPLSLLARQVAPSRHQKVHWEAAKRVLRYLCSTSGMGLVLGGLDLVVLTGHSDASGADDQATQKSSEGYTFSRGSKSVSWRSTRSSSVFGSSCEAEIDAGAMVAQELRWLAYLLADLGERPRSPPVLYVDNKAMLALCHEQRLEHIALRYFLARELQQCGQLCLSYMATRANTADAFTKALESGGHQRFCTALGLLPMLHHLLVS
ncbi:unnamed protein product [Closterium sp. NIES-54]